MSGSRLSGSRIACLAIIMLGVSALLGTVPLANGSASAASTAVETVPWYLNPEEDAGSTVNLSAEQERRAVAIATADRTTSEIIRNRDYRVSEVIPWSTRGTEESIVGAVVTLAWSAPAELEGDWPAISFSSDEEYTVATLRVHASGVSILEITVRFDPPAVVAISPGNGEIRAVAQNQILSRRALIAAGSVLALIGAIVLLLWPRKRGLS